MMVIADGDVIKNNIVKNGPLELGFDRGTWQLYGNKEFLLNAINYLWDDYGLINIRSKQVTISFLNYQKIANQKIKWQLINILLPLVFISIFGILFNFNRKRGYGVYEHWH